MAIRKLQAEIDRTLKKVGEGIVEFDAIFQKIHTAPSANQKEKHENDLKREIKKLQRLREQIKAWVGQSDVKNKEPLIDARQKIEKEMERYKVYERESKTKEFSNEGLRLKMKHERAAKLQRQHITEWLLGALDQAAEQTRGFEQQIKDLEGKDTDDPDVLEQDALRIAELDDLIERHKQHLENMNKLLNKFKIKKLSVESVVPVKDALTTFLDAEGEDPDNLNDKLHEMYLTLDLDNLSGENAAEDEDEEDEEDGDDEDHQEDDEADQDDEPVAETPKPTPAPKVEPIKAEPPAPPVPAKVAPKPEPRVEPKPEPAAIRTEPKPELVKPKPVEPTPAPVVKPAEKAVPPPAQRAAPKAQETAPTPAQQKGRKNKGTAIPLGSSDDSDRGTPVADLAVASGLFQGATTPTAVQPPPPVTQQAKTTPLARSQQNVTAPAATPTPTPAPQPTSVPAQPILAPALVNATAQSSSVRTPSAPMPAPIVMPAPPASAITTPTPTLSVRDQMLKRSMFCIPDSSLGVAAASTTSSGESMLAIVDYEPRSPVQAPASFPTAPATAFDDPAFFEKLDTDTLFLIFYYQQGTYQQYLAAKELKRQSWRYHKKYLTWFQRHEEPKEITPDYEQGSYIYFDCNEGWCQRKKTGFTFEYQYLEDV